MNNSSEPCLIVMSGPSGAGKSTLARRLLEDPRVTFSVSVTTRSPRPDEVDGVAYRFVDEATFERELQAGAFLEHAVVHGMRYGTPKAGVERAIANGLWVVLDIDVQGAETLRANQVSGLYILIAPPSMEALRERLVGRKTETEEQLRIRLANAERELSRKELYDHVIVNDELDRAFNELVRVIGLA